MRKDDPQSPRSRLKTLLAIPERNRTDEEWNEINDLEIALSPVNRRGDQPMLQGGPQQPRHDGNGNRGNERPGDRNPRHNQQARKGRKPRNKAG